MTNLTQKQLDFCQAIVEGLSQIDAYRQVYNVKEGASKNSVYVSASQLMADPKITIRIEELRAPATKKAQRTYAQWLQQVEDVAFVKPEQLEVKTPDMLKALELFGKATGYYQEKLETPLSALENTSTKLLLAMLEELKERKRLREAKIIDASHADQS